MSERPDSTVPGRIAETADIGTVEAIAVIGSAVATGILAAATFWLARSARETLREDRKQRWFQWFQTNALATQMDPLLKLHTSHFEGNTLVAGIENLGPGRAQLVGVESWFDPCKVRFSTIEGKKITEEEVKEIAKSGKTVRAKAWTLEPERRLNYENRGSARTAHMVSCLQNPRLQEPFLNPGEKVEVRVEPHFVVKPKVTKSRWMRRKGRESWLHYMNFDQMKSFLLSNHVPYVALGFQVICKNMMEEPIIGEAFSQLVMVVLSDSTLEEVEKRNFKHELVTLGPREWGKFGYIDREIYGGRFPRFSEASIKDWIYPE